ncbi:hypothetical protein [Xenophilus sp.]|jgi:hypothetical protein|uniref:hypothetical protein n=1 Tax=Xenophilus sp. TaxID=1873499 RepID=UPI0037DC434A
MNLDEPGKPHGEPLAPANWTMKMLQEANQYVAVVMLDGEPRCRVSIAATDQDEATARTALAEKARHWIKEYLDRPSQAPVATPEDPHPSASQADLSDEPATR